MYARWPVGLVMMPSPDAPRSRDDSTLLKSSPVLGSLLISTSSWLCVLVAYARLPLAVVAISPSSSAYGMLVCDR
jgi:hypothetical protein